MKGFEKIIKHQWFKRAMYTLAIINLYGYATKKKFNCLLSFVAAVMVTHYFIRKSIPLALLVGLFISSFVLGCGKILEGNTYESLMTEQQAGSVADALKLKRGGRRGRRGRRYSFAGNYGTKGLYAYRGGPFRGKAFFGWGGTSDQQQSVLNRSKYRPVKAVQEAAEELNLTPDVTGDTFCGENTSWVENKCKAEGSTFCGENTSWVQNKCIAPERTQQPTNRVPQKKKKKTQVSYLQASLDSAQRQNDAYMASLRQAQQQQQ